MKKSLFIAVISVLFLSYCSSNKEYPVKITEENGIKTVSNPDYPKEGIYDLVLEEIFTLGKEEDNSKYIFSKPFFMDIDSKNNIYILDLGGPKFFVFNNKGEFVRSFGKKGAGPGDLGGTSFFKISSADKIIINDMWNRRICKWNLNGDYLESFNYKKPLTLFELDSKNILYSTESEMDIEKLTDKYQFINTPNILVRHNPENNEWTSIRKYYGEKTKMQREADGGISSSGPYNEFIWKISGTDKLYTGFADTYEFSIYDLEGKPLSKFRREFKPVISPRYKKNQKGEQYLPAFTRYSLFDTAGNFWIDLDTEDSLGTHIYDVFSEDGIYQKQVHSKYILTLFKENIVYSLIRSKKEATYIKAFKYSLKKRKS